MPRDSGGLYGLPAGNPVVPFTVIESEWANPTMSDVAQALTDSLSRSGKGGMLAALRGLDGSAAVPAWTWTNEPSTGRYRAGPGQVVESVLGQPVVRYLATGLEQWDSNIMDWVPLTPRDALGTPFDPAPSNLTATNVQDAIEEVNDKTGGTITADSISYDDTNVYFPAATVQQAIDRMGLDIPGLANDILDNSDAILIVEGDLILLTSRVTQTEIATGNNTNNIALNTQQINANTGDISSNLGRIDSLELGQAVQDSNIQQNVDNIDFVFGLTQNNADDITINLQDIAQNAADISQNLTLINNNAADILGVFNITQTNAANISSNDTDIATNAAGILSNSNNFNYLFGFFSSDILTTAHGGTGTSETPVGSGPVVMQNNSATLDLALYGATTVTAGAELLVPTQATGNSSTFAASTAFVKNQGYGRGSAAMIHGNTLGSSYMAVRDVATGDKWQVTNFGRRTLQVEPGTFAQYALAFDSVNTSDVVIAPYVAGQSGINTAPGIESRATNGFTGISPAYLCGYVAMGEVAYSALFAAIPLSGDRYYNKVLGTEHIEQIYGPWTDNPDVVILPPGNTFWGPILDPDEDVTYDLLGLPNGRVPRIILANELIGPLLRAADITQSRLSRALLADSRGLPADLVAFNSDLDILVAAHPYTEAQFLENI